ncbi:uncharacterized protein LOC116779037 [Danaus plexippus]|uniref:uncharacterized protein LOC116779037 n=1 Tax=Danaus plexippus TaxID=13037 RepID=UPI002AB2EFF3|nr:uncharacterized protein LOC116779037 [Danaus plexippus]
MLRLGLAVLVIVSSAECWPASKEHGVLLERLRRSPHYCDPDPQPIWPAPQPPSPAPGPTPSSHVFPLPAPIFPPPFWRGHHHHHRYYEPQRYQEQNIRNLENDSNNPPCDSCDENKKPKNTAISNAQSETGNAVAIALLRS